jgi:hypothetical protein
MTPATERREADPSQTAVSEIVTLVVGVVCIGSLMVVGLLALTNVWLSLGVGAVLLVVGYGGARGGVPRALTAVTFAFGVSLVVFGMLMRLA